MKKVEQGLKQIQHLPNKWKKANSGSVKYSTSEYYDSSTEKKWRCI